MSETQRERVPRDDGGELDTALAFLRFARHCVLKKADGLEEADLRRPLVDSGTTILGLVQHLADSEHYWFAHTLAGDEVETHHDFSMEVGDRSTADVLEEYRLRAAASDEIIVRVGDPGARTARPVDETPLSLRWVLAHMTSETARHAGHADILREQLDGITGR